MTKDEQALFDANHLMIAGTLAHHWTEQACKDWMAAQKELPWRIHIGCSHPDFFSVQIVNEKDGKAYASYSLSAEKPEEMGSGCYISPSFPQVRLSSIKQLAAEVKKEACKPARD